MRSKKKIKKSFLVGERMKSHEVEILSDEQKKPLFSLSYIEKDYCLSNCVKEEKAAFADKLHRLSQLTWAEIKNLNRHKLGSEIIPRNILQGTLPSIVKEDSKIIAFRFHGKAPMIGFRDGHIFYILRLDRSFKAYSHR